MTHPCGLRYALVTGGLFQRTEAPFPGEEVREWGIASKGEIATGFIYVIRKESQMDRWIK